MEMRASEFRGCLEKLKIKSPLSSPCVIQDVPSSPLPMRKRLCTTTFIAPKNTYHDIETPMEFEKKKSP